MPSQRPPGIVPTIVVSLGLSACLTEPVDAPLGTARGELLSGLLPSQPFGTLPGQSQVGADGSVSYTIALDVPAGRAGVQPALTLGYSSRGGNGLAGVGWSLSGLSSIPRCGLGRGRDG